MVELVAIFVVTVIAVRRSESSSSVVQPHGSLVLPAIDAPSPRTRMARGSVIQPATSMPEELPRRRAVLRPTHARR